ncbi:MAG: hypothetical protein ACO1OB_10655 [Archangium sp.]
MNALTWAAYGFLTLAGTLHFVIDVVSQKLRGVRAPSPETTLYYGLNASFALGQVALGAVGLWLMAKAPELVKSAPMTLITLLAGLAWLAITFLFIEYREPKIAVSLFLALFISSVVSRFVAA